jgi:2-aminoadipate transaminase
MGLPDPATFPRARFVALLDEALAEDRPPLLYGGPGRAGIARGFRGLRAALAERAGSGADCAPTDAADGIMLTSGAAQAIELVWRAFLDRGDAVVVEAPTWGAAIRLGRALGAEPVAIPMDRDGLRVEVLEREIARLHTEGRRLRLVYTISSYNTPTGWSLSLERRRRLLELAERHDFLVVDDRVYADLRYDGPRLPPLASLPGGERVITVGSFSKTLAPALRLGWLMAEPAVVDGLARGREDLGSSQLTAHVLERFIHTGGYDEHLSHVTRVYRGKRDTVASALGEVCGDALRFDLPDGGMFFWIKLADDIDGSRVMTYARRLGVVCRPGEAFFGDRGAHRQWFRMAFTMVPEAELVRGVHVLGEAIGHGRAARRQRPLRT